MSIVGIERIHYGVEDMEAALKFHDAWGLERLEAGASGADLRLLNGTTLHLRRADDGRLPPPTISWLHLNRSTAREVVWGVDSEASLQAIGAELTKDREVTADNTGTLHTTDPYGFHLGFAVTQRREIALTPPATNSVGTYARRDRPADGTIRRKVGPYRMGHVVYWSPPDGLDAALRFYTERLGFRITDNMTAGGRFMQCSGSEDHHSLLLQCGGDFRGFQHVAYEFRDFDEVMLLGVEVEKQGFKTNVGPLRHNVSGTFSWYLWNPAGGVSEAYCDMDCAGKDWVVRTFNPREDPTFYGSAWVARPEHDDIRPAQWVD